MPKEILECTVFVCTDPDKPLAAAKFALDQQGGGHFTYGRNYLDAKQSFSFDPLHLPLKAGQSQITIRDQESFGVLSDAGPNSWGRKVLASISRSSQLPMPRNPVEWLLHSYNFGAGCLSFSARPEIAPALSVKPQTLSALSAKFIRAIEQFDQMDELLDQEEIRLLTPGSSLGGARPKTVLMNDGVEWIAKFSKSTDLFNYPMVEYATMRLAHLANIHVPDFEVLEIGGLPVFLIQRFDRNCRAQRLHYISANSLVGIDKISARGTEYATQYSYGGIAEIGRSISDTPIDTSHELFRRMVFNILIGNIDDHLRNHGFIYSQERKLYTLSPAFDLLPNLESGPQYIGVGAQGRASTMANAISQCTRFYLNKDQALLIINDVYSVIAQWKKVFQECGVAKKDIHVLQTSFFSHAQFTGEMNALR